jgi:cobaltochelatase CobT
MGPFPDTTVEAVGTCLRTLAQNPDADSGLAASTAATLSGLRAFADRIALRRRFHDADAHADHRPADGHTAALYDQLEHARLDAIGARWLAGMARNLRAHPGLDDDGLRWLAFEALSGAPAPPEKSPLAPPSPGACRARSAAGWPTSGAIAMMPWRSPTRPRPGPPMRLAFIAASTASGDGSSQVLLPRRDVRLRQLRSGATPAARKRRCVRIARAATHRARPAPARRSRRQRTLAAITPTRPAFDRVVNALTLANRAELVELHTRLETELSAARTVVARLAKRLMRVLLAKQTASGPSTSTRASSMARVWRVSSPAGARGRSSRRASRRFPARS